MRKSLFVSLVIVLICASLIVIGCGNGGGGGSDTDWNKPAWAGDGVFPLIAYDADGNALGYVIGIDFGRGWVKIYNEELDKFFEMTIGWGNMRGYAHFMNWAYADANCNPYMWQGYNKFLYYDHEERTPLIPNAEFYTFSADPATSVGYQGISKQLILEDDGQGIGINVWACYDYDPAPYWSVSDPDVKFYPAVEYTGDLPFNNGGNRGKGLTFSSN